MAERIVSPGVFTKEVDQSFLAGGIASIGAAIVGPTTKGPALVPTQITSFADFTTIFGSYTDDSYVPFVVNDYLRNGNTITVTRLLYEDGYKLTNGALAIIANSGSVTTTTSASFALDLTSAIAAQYSASFNATQVSLSGSTAQIIFNSVSASINANTTITASFSNPTLTVTATTAGSAGNAFTGGPTGSQTAFTGGTTPIPGVSYVTHVLHPTETISSTGATNIFQNSTLADAGSGSFALKVSGSYEVDIAIPGYKAFLTDPTANTSCSIQSTTPSYITSIFGKSPKSRDYPVYVQYEHPQPQTLFANLGNVTLKLALISNHALEADYRSAETPWITSQKQGSTAKDLFKFYTISHGTSANHELKIGISNIKFPGEISATNGYGEFTVVVRRVNTSNIANSPYSSQDTDSQPEILETFNVNLDPKSPKYIGRVIGDKSTTITDSGDIITSGTYLNQSKYIRVEIEPSVESQANAKTLLPFGFRSIYSPIAMPSASVNLKSVEYVTSQAASGTYNASTYFGFDYTNVNNLNYLAPVPTSGSTTGSNLDFNLGAVSQSAQTAWPSLTAPYTGSIDAAITAGTTATNIALSTRKFIVPMQFGFDGARPNLPKYSGANITETNVFGFDCSTPTSAGTKAYNKAFTLLSNTDYYDMNMLITPGILNNKHGNVTSLARSLVQMRQDTFYVMDTHGIDSSITNVVTDTAVIDNNYVASYWPWVQILNPSTNTPVYVPPSVVVPGVLAFNDRVAAPWYAPAGLSRGGITGVLDTYVNLTQANRDTLYENRINPIANFPNDGIAIWGQKTLQAVPSALDRVNVRRLLIAVKKFIASSTRYLVFEQNTLQTRSRFLNIVEPYMTQVQANQGLFAFKVVMDASNNTPALIDQNILYGQIFLQPTRTAEFIVLDFNIQPTGAAFPGQ